MPEQAAMPQAPSARYWAGALAVVAAGLSLFHLYTAFCGVLTPFLQRFVHLFGVLLIVFMARAASSRARPHDLAWLVLACAAGAYFFWALTPERILERGFSGPSLADDLAGLVLVLLVLEAARRTVGWGLVAVAACFLAYAFLGPWLPEAVAHKGYSPGRLMAYLVWSTDGVFGIPLAVSATFVMVFLVFGALLDRLGAGKSFLDLALVVSGRVRGGPALTAVAASGFMGSISGSAVSNVVTTGAITVPMMIDHGFKPRFAAGVEAAASTGGQIMPPVMGAAAFVLAEMAGVSYGRVALAAAIPAALYFLSLGVMVYCEARRLGIPAVARADLPRLGPTLAQGWHLFPPVALLVWLLLIEGRSALGAGAWAVAALAACGAAKSLASGQGLPAREMGRALVNAGRIAAPVATACATAGIVIGVVGLTGLGVRFTRLLASLAGGELWPALVMTMAACLVLGAGLPTTAAYVITAVLGVPTLTALGVDPLAAHLFVFYFAIISFITPPVAISAFAAAGLAGTGPMRTGFTALRLGAVGFLVPFFFVYHPALVLQGAWWEVLAALGLALVAAAGLSGALGGWLLAPLGPAARMLAGAASLVVGLNQPWLSAAGLVVLAAVAGGGRWAARRRADAPPARAATSVSTSTLNTKPAR